MSQAFILDYERPPEVPPPAHMQQAKWIWEKDGTAHLDVIIPTRNMHPRMHISARVGNGCWQVYEDRELVAFGTTSNDNWQRDAERIICVGVP